MRKKEEAEKKYAEFKMAKALARDAKKATIAYRAQLAAAGLGGEDYTESSVSTVDDGGVELKGTVGWWAGWRSDVEMDAEDNRIGHFLYCVPSPPSPHLSASLFCLPRPL